MNREERVRVGETWLGLAQMYGREIPRAALTLMLNAVDDLDADAILVAFETWAKTSKQNRHPLPADLREIVSPVVDDDTLARDAASRIVQAISKFGWCNSQAAKEFIGELGWHVVGRNGGWSYICENFGLGLDPGVFQAQARELAKSQSMLAKAGKLDTPPALPEPASSVVSILPGLRDLNKIAGVKS